MRRPFDIRRSTFRDGVTPQGRVAINRSGDPSLKRAVMRVPTLRQFDFERSGRRDGASIEGREGRRSQKKQPRKQR
jgi:hypothetical protein